MKNLYDETSKFSMADDEDYDEYEEEVVERDEEYDDGEEDYDEEYDDEEYDDEEEYDEEEPEEEYDENYDDGYDEGYYDDRLNQVLDELAELKRNMTTPPAVQSPISPLQPHLLFSVPQNNSNEVVMYNEISRLRDELSKTQNSQSMHVEMSRLKEEMEREQKQNESQFLAEIKRLNERIEELQGGPKSANAMLSGGNGTAGLLPEGTRPTISPKDMSKLVSANETLLRATQDNDARIRSEVSEVKTDVADVKTEVTDVKTDVSEVKAGIADVKARVETLANDEELKNTVAEIRSAVQALRENADADNGARFDELNAAVASLKKAMEENAQNAAQMQAGTIDPKLIKKLARGGSDSVRVDLTEVIRSVYEIKGMLGSNDPNQQALVNMALKAYTDLDLLHITVANSTDFRKKLEAVENFVSAVNAQDFITSDALSAYDIVRRQLLDTPIDGAVFDSLCSFASSTGKITIPTAKKDAVYKYITLSERAKREDVDAVIEFLPEMITAINDAENAKNVTTVNSLYDDIVTVQEERKTLANETQKHEAETEIRSLIGELCDMRVGDVVTYAPVMPLPTSDAVQFSEGDSVSDRINALLLAAEQLRDSIAGLTSGIAPSAESEPLDTETVAPSETVQDMTSVQAELASLSDMLTALNAKVNLDGVLGDMQRNFAAVANRLANIENRLVTGDVPTEEQAATTYEEVPVVPTYTDESIGQVTEMVERIGEKIDTLEQGGDNTALLDDLGYIKEKLTEQENILGQIADLRSEVAAITENADEKAQFDKLYEDLTAQFDKLYDDLAAVDGETADKLNEKLAELKEATDMILSSDLSSAVLDGIIDLRATVDENTAATADDRRKLLEDVAYVREQIEKLVEAQGSGGVSNEDLAAQIESLQAGVENGVAAQLETAQAGFADEVAAQLQAVQAEIVDSVKAIEDGLAVLQENENASVNEHAAAEQVQADHRESVNAALAELKEKSDAIENSINTNSLLTNENQAALSDDLARILEILSAPEGSEQTTNLYDEVTSIAARLEVVRETFEQANADTMSALADIKEQVHLKELEQDVATVAQSEEEKKTLLSEIAALRERLSLLESGQKEQAEATSTQLGMLIDQITSMTDSLQTQDAQAVQSAVDTLNARLDEVSEANNVTASGLDKLLTELADVKAALEGTGENAIVAESMSDIVKMQDDITFIRNQIEANIDGTAEDDSINASLESEGLSLIMDDIAAIKEKLASLEEYDTVAEILSLREDVKSTRLLDSNDVAAELESLKGDLMELKSDIADMRTREGDATVLQGEGAPTSDEVNMLLGEIVSLRDEIQAYKDDVNNIVTIAKSEAGDEPTTAVADESITVILDELTGLHNDIDGLKEESLADQAGEINEIKAALSELKDMISRRTTIADDTTRDSAVSNELNVVLDEIINIKDEVAALKNDFATANETVAAERESDAQAEKAALADEMQAFKSELYAMVSEKLEELTILDPQVSEELQNVKEQLANLQALALGGVVQSDDAQASNALLDELHEVKELLAQQAATPVVSMDALYDEIHALRDDLEAVKGSAPAGENITVAADETLVNEVLSLREELAAMREQLTAPSADDGEGDLTVLNEVMSLREELQQMREQLGAQPAAEQENAVVLGEVMSLREELQQMREQLGAQPAAEQEPDQAVLGELAGLREELELLRESTAANADTASLMETVDAIKEDVRAIKEEPDLGIINEVLALRDEFQAFKDEMHKTRTAPVEDKSKEELAAQVQSLRDQLFAISMANVNDGTSDNVVYESYNNIILDEITSLRDEIALLKRADDTRSLSDDLSRLDEKLTNIAVDDREKTQAQLRELRQEIAALQNKEEDVTNNAIVQEIAALKEEFANQREADATTLNYLTELAQLLERQNAYLGQSDSGRLSEEIGKLSEEIASSRNASAPSGDDIRGELESIRAAIGAVTGETVVADNSAVLEELAALRVEVKKLSAADGNKKILREIAKIQNEIGAMAERESGDDGALSRSINDLKAELNQLAGFVDEDEQTETAPASSPKKQTGKKSGGKSSGGRRKASPKPQARNEENGLTADSLMSKIDEASLSMRESASGDEMALNFDYAPEAQPIPATSEEMDIAARIAKQVANKLIMEQLVQQLGDGSVPHSEVEEIVKDILPQEFTTIAVDEQTDKVRRLANSLVLDKLRARLKK